MTIDITDCTNFFPFHRNACSNYWFSGFTIFNYTFQLFIICFNLFFSVQNNLFFLDLILNRRSFQQNVQYRIYCLFVNMYGSLLTNINHLFAVLKRIHCFLFNLV